MFRRLRCFGRPTCDASQPLLPTFFIRGEVCFRTDFPHDLPTTNSGAGCGGAPLVGALWGFVEGTLLHPVTLGPPLALVAAASVHSQWLGAATHAQILTFWRPISPTNSLPSACTHPPHGCGNSKYPLMATILSKSHLLENSIHEVVMSWRFFK